jgi:copper chaperone CopZ
METVLKVTGMTCQGCVRSVSRVLQEVPGVDAVEVSLERGEAAVRHDPGRAPPDVLRRAVEDAGFAAA